MLSEDQQMVLSARLYTTAGKYARGLAAYDTLINRFSNKYYLLEYAQVLMGKGEFTSSMEVIEKGKGILSQSEYSALISKATAMRRQNSGTEFAYFQDIGGNQRIENAAWWEQGQGRTYRLGIRTGQAVMTSAEIDKTTSKFIHLNVFERWNKAWSGQTDIHLQRIEPKGGKSFGGLTGKQTLQYQPTDRKMVGVSVSSDILNYTASLFEKNIRRNSVGYVTHLMFSGKTGFYSQGSVGLLSDSNRSYQFFGSVYHVLRTEPTLKAGLNLSAVHFSDHTVTTYFSPDRYLSTEVFADYSTPLPALSKFYFQIQAAVGAQQIERQSWQPAFRFSPEIGVRLNHFETSLKYQTSNVSSSTGTGYKFDWFTFKLIWRW